MPTFEFTSPDGKKYSVNGPEGATKEQAFGILQQQLGMKPAPAASSGGAAAIPGASPEQLAAARSGMAPQQRQEDTLLGKVVGPFDAAITAAGGALAAPISVPAGFVQSMFNDKRPQENAQAIAERLTPKPATATGRKILEKIGEAAPVLEALPGVGGEIAQLGRASAPAAQIATGATAAGASKLSQMAGSAASKVVPKIDPATANLARVAQEKYGIPLRPDQLYENRLSRMAGEASEKVPLSGAKNDVRQEAFNKAIIRTIGGDDSAARLTPDVFDKAMRTSGQKIGDIAARHPLSLDEGLNNALESHIVNAAKYETADVGKAVNSYIADLRSKAESGVVPGEAVRKLNTAITNKMRSTTNGDLKYALGQLQDDIQNAVQKNLTGEDLAEWRNARQQYAYGKTIEPLVGKSSVGDISPAGLMGRVTADSAGKSRMARGRGGDLGELARIGQRFLKEPASSGTTERNLVYGLLGGAAGGAAYANPAPAVALYGGANLYNRAGPAIARKLSGAGKPQQTTLADMAGAQQ